MLPLLCNSFYDPYVVGDLLSSSIHWIFIDGLIKQFQVLYPDF